MNNNPELVIVEDRPYLARGWINGISAPIGTILGPNNFDEYLTVVESEANRVRVAHSRPDDFTRVVPEARSVCEHRLMMERHFRKARSG